MDNRQIKPHGGAFRFTYIRHIDLTRPTKALAEHSQTRDRLSSPEIYDERI